jgi:2,4-dienoyl-CoA reductase-like NADH-dependent reductase (Old Yellow Enzyme family)
VGSLEAFTPGRIGGLVLRNRIIRAGCFEGMCPGGACTEALIAHHVDVARGRAMRRAVRIPVVLVGGVCSPRGLQRASEEGFEFVQMGRVLIHDPAVVCRWRRAIRGHRRVITVTGASLRPTRAG